MAFTSINKTKLPRALWLGSFCILIGCLSFTSPEQSVTVVLIFFPALLVFLFMTTMLAYTIITGKSLPKVSKYKLAILFSGVVLALMFFAAQSLGWIDLLAIFLIVGGINFYISRRLNPF